MRKTLIYDLPTRLFHWFFSILFLVSFIIAKTIDDESVLFSYHMLSGITLGGLVLWRVMWGILGSTHARFSGFSLNPVELKNYLLGVLSGAKNRWTGHNPASSWAAIAMFTLAFGLSLTGYLMASGQKETFEDLHELMANTFIVIVFLHVLGLVLHSVRHRDAIALSMFDGKKELTNNSLQISSTHRFAAALLMVLVISSGAFLLKNFDAQNKTLKLFGQTLNLGETESEH